jgi:hypothetical protein
MYLFSILGHQTLDPDPDSMNPAPQHCFFPLHTFNTVALSLILLQLYTISC